MKKAKIILLASILLTGCGLYEVVEVNNNPEINVVNETLETQIIDSLKDATREDCVTAYTFFAGMSLYIEKGSKLTNTSDIQELIKSMEDDYGWDRGKYPKFTEVIKTDIINNGFRQPKELTPEIKTTFINMFNGYGKACLKAAEQKK